MDYFMEVYSGSDENPEYDNVDSLSDVYDFAEENNERKLIKEIRLIFIKSGYFKEAKEKCVFFGRDPRMTVNGIKYQPAMGWENWING